MTDFLSELKAVAHCAGLKRLAISAGEDKDLSLGLLLATNSFGKPV